jgi:hypothetical protein
MTTFMPTFSPLEPIFAAHAAEIPLAFREQFLHSPDATHRVVLEGKMHHIWYRPKWLLPLFWLVGRLGILVPRFGRDIPTTLNVRAGRYPSGAPYHVWERTFYFPQPHPFPTTIIYDEKLGEVVDLVGPNDSLYIVWKAKFHPPNLFTLDSLACGIHLAGRPRWLPQWLWPWLLGVVRFTQRVDEQDDQVVHIELIISHPLFGDFFGYNGTFRAVRYPAR